MSELMEYLRILPPNITALDLANHGLHRKTTGELIQICSALPSQVSELTLSLKDIQDYSQEELKKLAEALPNLVKINLIDENGKRVHGRSAAILQQYIDQSIKETTKPTVFLNAVKSSEKGHRMAAGVIDVISSYISSSGSKKRVQQAAPDPEKEEKYRNPVTQSKGFRLSR